MSEPKSETDSDHDDDHEDVASGVLSDTPDQKSIELMTEVDGWLSHVWMVRAFYVSAWSVFGFR